MSLRTFAKSRLLPAGSTKRKLPFGLARGLVLDIDFRSQTIFYLGLYEVELVRHFKSLCRPGLVCWDIGASVGYDTLILAKLTGSSVVAFEPDEQAQARFRANLAANRHLAAKVTLVPASVSSEPKGQHVVSLDYYMSQSGGPLPDVLKIDVEGAESEVLQGGLNTILAAWPSIILEVHSRQLEVECEGLLRSLGYHTQIVNARRWLKETRPIPHNRWIIAPRPA